MMFVLFQAKTGTKTILKNYIHQIGINVHEHPWINTEVNQTFKPGMVMCIEPKIWLLGEAYIRVEDMVLITEEGAESLTTFDREKFEI